MKLIHHITSQINSELPGKTAQFKMAPPGRQASFPSTVSSKEASVLLMLYPRETQWHTVFIRRSTARGHHRHRGQISLPGGKRESKDLSFAYTALRETEEEIGVKMNDVQLIGALSELYIPVSDFHVYPFVGYLDYAPNFVLEEEEVDEVLEVPIDHLSDPAIRRKKDMILVNGFRLPDVPYFSLDGEVLWGATAMIISEFLELLPGNKA